MRILSLLLILVSCAGWRLEETERVGKYPSDVEVVEKIKLNFVVEKFDHFYNGELKESSLSQTKKLEMIEDIKMAYLDSGLFILEEKSPELTVKINIKSEGSGSMNRAILTYATFFLVPSSSETKYTVESKFIDRDGDLLGSIEKSDTVVKWQQLFMIFAMPFKYPHFALSDTLVDLNRSTIVQAFRDGYFREVKL